MQPADPNQPPQPFESTQPAPMPEYNQPLPPAPPGYPSGPGYAGSPGHPGGYGSPAPYGPPAPTVRFDAIGEAWKLFQAEMGTWVLTYFLISIVMFSVMGVCWAMMFSTIMSFSSVPAGKQPSPQMIEMMMVRMFSSELVFFVVFGFFALLIQGGVTRMAIRQIRGQKIVLADVCSITDVFWPLVGVSFLVYLCTWVGSMFCYVPGFIAMGTLMFAVPLVVDGGLGAGEALTKSWDTLKGHLWAATGFYLVVCIVAELGMMACMIGIVFTAPLMPLAIAVLYRDFFITPRAGEIQITSTDSGAGPPIPEAG